MTCEIWHVIWDIRHMIFFYFYKSVNWLARVCWTHKDWFFNRSYFSSNSVTDKLYCSEKQFHSIFLLLLTYVGCFSIWWHHVGIIVSKMQHPMISEMSPWGLWSPLMPYLKYFVGIILAFGFGTGATSRISQKSQCLLYAGLFQ